VYIASLSRPDKPSFNIQAELEARRRCSALGLTVDAYASVCALARQLIHEINTVIMKWRERRGLEPIGDPLSNEPPSAFQLIRPILSLP
jgi:hypothetical protein